jgi:hypothetical protein
MAHFSVLLIPSGTVRVLSKRAQGVPTLVGGSRYSRDTKAIFETCCTNETKPSYASGRVPADLGVRVACPIAAPLGPFQHDQGMA